jgi:hypothetical protein
LLNVVRHACGLDSVIKQTKKRLLTSLRRVAMHPESVRYSLKGVVAM